MIIFSLNMAPKKTGDQASHHHGDQASKKCRVMSGEQARSTGGQASAESASAVNRSHHQSKKCKICSHNQLGEKEKRSVYHRHFSSKLSRELGADQDDSAREYFCPTCKRCHPSITQPRLKICLSSSILHEFWQPRDDTVVYDGDKLHIDYLTIPGAHIMDLVEAWKIEYFQETRPMDVFILAGLNNLAKGDKVDSMLRDYDHLVQIVQYQGKKYHPQAPNTCVIGTLYYPPQICWFPDQGKCPDGFNNLLDAMYYLNHEIERLNFESGIKSPNIPVFGTRKITNYYTDKTGEVKVRSTTTTHRFTHFRESDWWNMLHLNDERRIKLGQRVNRFFLHETGH